jgi:hypothetical protein
MATHYEVEEVAWRAIDIAKELALTLEDRRERLSVIETLESLEDGLVG